MKKVLSLALLIIFITSFAAPAPASAAGELTFSLGVNVAPRSDGTVTVPITVSNNVTPGFAAVGLVITFNPNDLKLTSISTTTTELPPNSEFELNPTQGTQWISLVRMPTPRDWSGNGCRQPEF